VFTRENVSTIPDLSSSSFPDMDDIQINVNGVAQLLRNLDPQMLQAQTTFQQGSLRCLQWN